MKGNIYALGKADRQAANIYYKQGMTTDISSYIYPNIVPSNFVISGFAHMDERRELLCKLYDSVKELYPVVLICSGELGVEPAEFEPFYGMTDIQVITAVRRLADKLNYTVTPKFERVVRGHIQILKALGEEVSLSGFYYLNQYQDMGEFYDNVMALPCGEQTSVRIWSDLGVDDASDNNQFDLFRAVIDHFSYEALQNGWRYGDEIADNNCLFAVKRRENFVLSVSAVHSDLLFTYLTEELKACGSEEFILLIDGAEINDDNFFSYLSSPVANCHMGLISENIISQVGGDENFFRLSEKIDCFVLFKHGTAKTASALAEIIGRCDHMKIEASKGYSQRAFQFLSYDRHDDIRYSTENRYRIMPEEIMALDAGQAIIFDTVTDQIVYFN